MLISCLCYLSGLWSTVSRFYVLVESEVLCGVCTVQGSALLPLVLFKGHLCSLPACKLVLLCVPGCRPFLYELRHSLSQSCIPLGPSAAVTSKQLTYGVVLSCPCNISPGHLSHVHSPLGRWVAGPFSSVLSTCSVLGSQVVQLLWLTVYLWVLLSEIFCSYSHNCVASSIMCRQK